MRSIVSGLAGTLLTALTMIIAASACAWALAAAWPEAAILAWGLVGIVAWQWLVIALAMLREEGER